MIKPFYLLLFLLLPVLFFIKMRSSLSTLKFTGTGTHYSTVVSHNDPPQPQER